jgi:hypothetical protein
LIAVELLESASCWGRILSLSGGMIMVATPSRGDRLQHGVELVEVDPNQPRAGSVSSDAAGGDVSPDGPGADSEVLGGLIDANQVTTERGR